MTSRNSAKSHSKRSRSRSPVKTTVRSKRLLVSNIPFTTTFNELKDLFKEKIGMCGRLEFIERNGKFTGNATMEFKSLDGAQKAIDVMHKYEINGRDIVVREESSKDRERLHLDNSSNSNIRPAIQSESALSDLVREIEREGPITNSIFISNLDYSITWQKLKDMFKSAGRVRHVDIKTDEAGKSRGFSIVEFETAEEAVLAIHLFNNKAIGNREMRIRMDKSGKALSGRLNLSKYVGNESSSSSSNLNPDIRHMFEDIIGGGTPNSRKNPQALKALDELLTLAKMFEKPAIQQNFSAAEREFNFGGGSGISSARNYDLSGNDNFMSAQQNYDDSPYFNDSRMMGINKMSNFNDFGPKSRDYPPASSSRVIDYNDSTSGRLNLDYSSPPSFAGSRNLNYSSNGGNVSGVGGSGGPGFDMNMVEDMLYKMKCSGNLDQNSLMNVISNVMKRTPESNNKPYVNSRSSEDFLSGNSSPSILLIKNIPFSYSWKDLKVSFAQVPGIEQIEILRDDRDRSKGVGLVRFESSSDAIRCKNLMDGTLLDGRPIHIEFSNSL